MNALQVKLAKAQAEVLKTEAHHRREALAIAGQDGQFTASARMDKAVRAVESARQAVINLSAAIEESESNEAERIASEAAAAELAESASLNAALVELGAVGAGWDEAMSALVVATEALMEAQARLTLLNPQGGYISLDRARSVVPTIFAWRNRSFLGDTIPFFTEELAKITTHLPRPRD